MPALIGLLGLFGFVVCLVIFIVAAIRKKPKKIGAIGMAVCFILFVVGLAITPPRSDSLVDKLEPAAAIAENSTLEAEISEPVSSEPTEVSLAANALSEASEPETSAPPADEPFQFTDDFISEACKAIATGKVVDAAIEVDGLNVSIALSLDAKYSEDVVRDLGDSAVRLIATYASVHSDLKGVSFDYYGELWEQYSALVGVYNRSGTEQYALGAKMRGVNRITW